MIGVIGSGDPSPETDRLAEEVGRGIAKGGAILINGGLGGVMEASARGAKDMGGLTVGILPGLNASDANPHIDIAIPTGLGDMRNFLIVRASNALIAVDGSYGTLSEIAIALKMKKPVIGIKTWDISHEIYRADTPEEAVSIAFDCAKKRR